MENFAKGRKNREQIKNNIGSFFCKKFKTTSLKKSLLVIIRNKRDSKHQWQFYETPGRIRSDTGGELHTDVRVALTDLIQILKMTRIFIYWESTFIYKYGMF